VSSMTGKEKETGN